MRKEGRGELEEAWSGDCGAHRLLAALLSADGSCAGAWRSPAWWLVALAVVSAQPAQGATIQVPCSVPSLIGAINTANHTVGADTLNLASGCTYILVARDNAFNGLPVITSDITINGSGATITPRRPHPASAFRRQQRRHPDAEQAHRQRRAGRRRLPQSVPDHLRRRHRQPGDADGQGQPAARQHRHRQRRWIRPLGGAVAIAPEATVTLTDSEVSGNTVGNTGTGSANGGGIGSNGSLTIINSRVADNTLSTTSCVTSCGFGAGINSFGSATMRNSIVSGNTASTPGGLLRAAGIVNGGSMAITGTAIRNNRASAPGGFVTGGGIATGAALSMTSSIVSDNTATAQGGTVEGAGISVGPFGH